VEVELGILLGILLLTIVMTLADQGGVRSIQIFFQFATFITPLIILRILNSERIGLLAGRLNWLSNSLILSVSTCVLIILAFPTFLANNPSVDSQLTYNIEYSTFSFFQDKLGNFSPVTLYGDTSTLYPSNYFLEDATIYLLPYAPDIAKTEAEFFAKVPIYLDSFNNDNGAYFVYSPRISHEAYMDLGISEQNPVWDEVTNALHFDDKIYDNGFDSITINQR
jgi:hypothetical protein